jgi:hypothetical protein
MPEKEKKPAEAENTAQASDLTAIAIGEKPKGFSLRTPDPAAQSNPAVELV